MTDIHAPSGIRTHSLSWRAAIDLCLRPRDHWDWHIKWINSTKSSNSGTRCKSMKTSWNSQLTICKPQYLI